VAKARAASQPRPAPTIVGRVAEIESLQSVWDSPSSELVAVYGRRRVGKTHLVREFFEPRADVYLSVIGQKDASLATQLHHFKEALERALYGGAPLPRLRSWDQALGLLSDALESRLARRPDDRTVVFLDELPWLASRRSGLLQALDHHWNARLSRFPGLRLIVCGSAASWMLEKLIHAKGGLHNRITRRMLLRPFSLGEAQDFLASQGMRFGRAQVLEAYLAVGGIPHYLRLFRKGRSAAQNIGTVCFDRGGPLHDEFERLFTSLFSDAEAHEELVRAIAARREGVTRNELIERTSVSSGGRLRARLRELEEAGFIASLTPYRRKRQLTTYRLIDEYVWFYLKWIERAPRGILAEGGADYWLAKSCTPSHRAWSGYAFEGLCLKHAQQIKRALGITAIASEVGTWRHVAAKGQARAQGAQIDLLFDREDGVINLCEVKYAAKRFEINKAYAAELRRKMAVFAKQTRTTKQLLLTLVAPHGVKKNAYSDELVDSVVTIDDLFA